MHPLNPEMSVDSVLMKAGILALNFRFSCKSNSNCHFGWCAGLLRGDPVSNRDRRPGTAGPTHPAVGSEGHLPAGLCAQRPGSHEGQVRLSDFAKRVSLQDSVWD